MFCTTCWGRKHVSIFIFFFFHISLTLPLLTYLLYLTLSEHFSQFISIKREKIDYKSESVFTRDYANFSSESFRDDISTQNWNNRYDNINDQFNDFHWRLDECINRHAPFKKLSPGEIKLKCKPWISNKITKMIKVRNKLFARKKGNQIMLVVVNFLKSSEIELIERS